VTLPGGSCFGSYGVGTFFKLKGTVSLDSYLNL
jgi:hypothetical protein